MLCMSQDSEVKDDVYNEEDGEELEEELEEIKVDEKNVDEYFDWLDESILNSVTSSGFYVVETTSVPLYDENGDRFIADAEEDEDYKERQKIHRVGIKELFDFTKTPPVIRNEFRHRNIIYCIDCDNLYYGTVNIKTFKNDKGNEEFAILANGRGRLYKDKKCQYAGYFNNGKKTRGLIFNDDGDKIFVDHKGDKKFEVHNQQDLLISFENDDEKSKERRKTDLERYKNAIIFSSKENCDLIKNNLLEDAKVKNIKIQIDNGYIHTFKKHNDYLDEKGNVISYDRNDLEKMYINVDKIVEKVKYFIEKNKDTLKTIEIAGISDYGVLKDKDGNNLIDKIYNSCKDLLMENNINLFFSNTDNYFTRVEEQYISGKKAITFVEKDGKYKKINKNGTYYEFENKSDYENELKKLGYFSNLSKSLDLENIESGDFCFLKSVNQKFDDKIEKINEKIVEEQNKEISEIRKKKDNFNDDKNLKNEIKQSSFTATPLSFGEWLMVFLSGVVLPVFGGFFTYYYLTSSQDDRDNINKNKSSSKKNKKNKDKKSKNNNKNDKQKEEAIDNDDKEEKNKDKKNKDNDDQKEDNEEEKNKDDKKENDKEQKELKEGFDNYSQERKEISKETTVNLTNGEAQKNI